MILSTRDDSRRIFTAVGSPLGHAHLRSGGFTLIELLIVVAVLGILAAIALPVLSSYRERAYNASAVSDLRSAKVMLEAFYGEEKFYP